MSADYSDNNPDLGALYRAHVAAVSARHDHALEQAGASHIVIYSGHPATAFLDDYQMPFKPNPHFVAWAPLTKLPSSCIVYTPGEKPRLVYYQPRDYWHVVPGEPDGYWTDAFDIRIVHDREAIAAELPAERAKCILIGAFDDPADAFGIERINPTTAINILHFARGRKTDYEVAVLKLASARAAAGHRAAEQAFRAGASEFDIHRAYCAAVSHTDPELPYGNIVALNEHGAILHYTDFDRQPPAEPRSFLIDAGAQVHGYAADVTRSYSFRDRDFSALIGRVDAMQRAIVAEVMPGVDFRELHVGTHLRLATLLADAGLASGSPESLLANGVTTAFFPHGLGHLLGVQVHDVGGFLADEAGMTIDPPSGHPYLRLTRVLEEDMVLTIEPGLYVIDLLLDGLRGTPAEQQVNWSAVDWLRPFGGIRIEDNVRVTQSAPENLTRAAFAQP